MVVQRYNSPTKTQNAHRRARGRTARGISMAVEPRRELEAKLRRWLRTHHGIISFHEALRLGATPSMIKSKVRRGEWERVYRSVYRDTATPPSPYQDLRAAYVATDRRAVVSHGSAAWVWDLLRQPPATPELSVPATTRLARGEPGFTLHRSRDLDVAQAVNRNGLVVTNPLRTIVDLAGSVLPDDLTEAVDSAVARRLVTVAGLEAEIERLARPGRAGTGALRRHLFDRGFIGAPPPSVLEARIRRLIVGLGLELPKIEYTAGEDGQYRLDLAWPAIMLAVEVDGYVWHFSPECKERDETRRNHLQQAGWTVLVYNWRQVIREKDGVGREIIGMHRRLSRLG
ncbi:MAG: hypothetical protein QOG44_153 [Acidimicrobiaceae bacterium]|nr:hypothetical protein [Acidimicrobiaceae bacterium]